MRKDSRIAARVSRWLYPLWVVGVSLVAVEIGVRWVVGDIPTADQVREQALPRLLNSSVTAGPTLRLSPNASQRITWGPLTFTVTTNSLGYRGREMTPRQGDERRVLLLGDSMVFGHGLQDDETMAVRLEELLRRDDPEAEVFNGAISGMNTVQQALTARRLVPLLEPDEVVLGYFVGNDPLANLLAEIVDTTVVFPPDRLEKLEARLQQHLAPLMWSAAFRVVALRAWVPRLRYVWSSEEEARRVSVRWIEAIQAECAAAGAELTVLMIYPRDGLAGGLTSWLSGSRGVGGRLVGDLRERGTRVVDSADSLAGAHERLYFEADGHPNAAGATAMAELLASDK